MSTSTSTRSSARKQLTDVVYTERADFTNGLLPTKRDVIENMMYLLRSDRAGKMFKKQRSGCFDAVRRYNGALDIL